MGLGVHASPKGIRHHECTDTWKAQDTDTQAIEASPGFAVDQGGVVRFATEDSESINLQ